MLLKSMPAVLTMLWFVLFGPFTASSKSFPQNPVTQAIQLFDKEKYLEAEPLFKKLIEERPDDFMVNYFYGACRTNNGHYSNQDLKYLEKASREVYPLDIDYYFGVQYHAKSNWEKAIEFYNNYGKSASANDREKVKLEEKIQQCRNQINPFTAEAEPENMNNSAEVDSENIDLTDENADENQHENEGVEANEIITEIEENIDTNEKDNTVKISVSDSINLMALTDRLDEITKAEQDFLTSKNNTPIEPETAPETKIKDANAINFVVNNEITYLLDSNFKTSEGKDFFEQWNLKQAELERYLKLAKTYREKYMDSNSKVEKDSLGQTILSIEDFTYELKSESDELLLKAKTIENEYWQNAGKEDKDAFIAELNKISEEKNEIRNTRNEKITDSTILIIPNVLIDDTGLESSATETITSDLIYKIQIGAYSRGLPGQTKQLYNKLSLIRKIENYTDENGVVVYTTGSLAKYDDALAMQKQVQQEGVKDAIIAPYLSGKRITLEKAKEIEGIK